MTAHTIVNPAALHDPAPFGYSHTVSVPASGELVFIAGQYASDAEGAAVDGNFATQVSVAFDKLGTALEAVGLGYRDVARLGTYVVDHDLDKLAALGKEVHRIWGDSPPAQTLSGVASLALPGMLFEVDAVAVRAPSAP
ncbi:RidA family protein [Streptomyces boncukensis]|uniref:RidA family protein n=1 Tax=Streptomyces boncukensis TaxID=2711219 RepID=A0A6G4WW30_9ACTN|nr:Rid family hydrolase [Streptomyces boncukensis]NGO68830.1 RidA family protein [Streptomyces boncukensis]